MNECMYVCERKCMCIRFFFEGVLSPIKDNQQHDIQRNLSHSNPKLELPIQDAQITKLQPSRQSMKRRVPKGGIHTSLTYCKKFTLWLWVDMKGECGSVSGGIRLD